MNAAAQNPPIRRSRRRNEARPSFRPAAAALLPLTHGTHTVLHTHTHTHTRHSTAQAITMTRSAWRLSTRGYYTPVRVERGRHRVLVARNGISDRRRPGNHRMGAKKAGSRGPRIPKAASELGLAVPPAWCETACRHHHFPSDVRQAVVEGQSVA